MKLSSKLRRIGAFLHGGNTYKLTLPGSPPGQTVLTFAMFRLINPRETVFEGRWKLNDIVLTK
ncbi:MAG: hypothetical protein AB7F74_12465 [Parvibaculaceae bacterium]